MEESHLSADFGSTPDVDPNADLTIDALLLFQRFKKPVDLANVHDRLDAEFQRHLKLCELAILQAAASTYFWCEIPEHPLQSITIAVVRHLEEQGFKVEFEEFEDEVEVRSHRNRTRKRTTTKVQSRWTVEWAEIYIRDRPTIAAEQLRRERIEADARAKHTPKMRSRLDGANIVDGGGAIWSAVLDGKYVIEIQTLLRQSTLCLFDLEGRCLHREPTALSFGALFGPDVGDVEEWKQRAMQIVEDLRETDP